MGNEVLSEFGNFGVFDSGFTIKNLEFYVEGERTFVNGYTGREPYGEAGYWGQGSKTSLVPKGTLVRVFGGVGSKVEFDEVIFEVDAGVLEAEVNVEFAMRNSEVSEIGEVFDREKGF